MRYSGFFARPGRRPRRRRERFGRPGLARAFRAAQHGESHPVARGRRLRDGSRAAQQPHDAGAPLRAFPRAGATLPHQEGEHRPHRDHGPRHPPHAPGSRTACYQGRVQPRLLRDSRGHGRLQRRRRRPPRLGELSSRLSRSVAAHRRRCGGRPRSARGAPARLVGCPLSAWRWRSGRRRCRRLPNREAAGPADARESR